MSDPTTTNVPATALDAVLADAMSFAEQAAETSAESALDAAVPALALPVIKEVTDEIIHLIIQKLGDRISVNLQQFGTFVVIDAQVSGEKTGISEALQNLMMAEKGGDPLAIQAAIQAYANAQSSLVGDDGSTPSQ